MHVVVAGVGGIGGTIAAAVALGGGEVSVIDAWPDHIEAIRADGLRIAGPSPAGERTARLPAFHIGEWWRLAPIDLLVIGTAVSTGGCVRSAMMAGLYAMQPTGGGFQYGTASLF